MQKLKEDGNTPSGFDLTCFSGRRFLGKVFQWSEILGKVKGCKNQKRTGIHRPGIEPGSLPWQGSILPLDQRCAKLRCFDCSNFLVRAGAKSGYKRRGLPPYTVSV